MDETKRLIIESSDKPMRYYFFEYKLFINYISIIIVGVGDSDFKAMNNFKGDSRLIDFEGRMAKR